MSKEPSIEEIILQHETDKSKVVTILLLIVGVLIILAGLYALLGS